MSNNLSEFLNLKRFRVLVHDHKLYRKRINVVVFDSLTVLERAIRHPGDHVANPPL